MRREIVIRKRFQNDLIEAMRYYADISVDLESEIFEAAIELIERISTNPELFALVDDEFRQKKCGKFPYLIIYRATTTKVFFTAFFQAQQSPMKKFGKEKK